MFNFETTWEVLYDYEPGYCTLSKKCKTKEAAKKEAERLEYLGYFIYDIQEHNPSVLMDFLDEHNCNENEEEEYNFDGNRPVSSTIETMMGMSVWEYCGL